MNKDESAIARAFERRDLERYIKLLGLFKQVFSAQYSETSQEKREKYWATIEAFHAQLDEKHYEGKAEL